MSFQIVKLTDNPVQLTFTGGVNPKGVYNNSTAYITGDSVSYSGSSYVAIQATTGNLPTNTTFWQLLAAGIPNNPIEVIPIGTINSVNKIFTISDTISNVNSLSVYRGGSLQSTLYGDFTFTGGNTITFSTAPQVGEAIIVKYNK